MVLTLIRFYRTAISPLTPASCRFVPTCSRYAMEAIEAHGLATGGWMATRRFLRCHPWGGYGFDPVPGVQGHADVPGDTPRESENPAGPGEPGRAVTDTESS